jgi:proton-translocating NADH-quinone oxidoreductase chain L
MMLVVVTFISSLVHLYSTEYMGHDPHLPRFMSYLSLFTFFMLILVTADNFVQMFVGWEGVGLCSFLLINFWFTRIQANKAAIKAMLLNRIGDFGLMLGILTIFIIFQTVDYATVFALVPKFVNQNFTFLGFDLHLLTLIALLLFVGAVGKSAQIGLHTWLPDAMEGPTPVSALIHAATMVTAGVFLIARCSPIFEYAPTALSVVTLMGAMTAFFAATTGLLQNDLKRVIAYSTCSQLGYMVFACGVSNYSVGVFHLANHAFFKALLFLGAGSVIHAVADEQDMRKMGGLRRLVPFTYSVMLIGSFSLMGLPFLTGFYSKDVILEVAYAKYTITGHFAYWLGTMAAFCTAFYSMRLSCLTFLSEPNGYRPVLLGAHDSPIRMALPLAILVVPSIFIGYLMRDMIIGLGTDFWGGALYVRPENLNMIDAEFIPTAMKLLPVQLSMFGAALSYILYTFYSQNLFDLKTSFIGQKLYNFLNRKWFFDKVYNEFFAQAFLSFGYYGSYKIIDRGIIEVFGPMGLSKVILLKANMLSKLQSGFIHHYAFFMLIGTTGFLTISQFWDTAILFVDLKLVLIFVATSFLSVSSDNN